MAGIRFRKNGSASHTNSNALSHVQFFANLTLYEESASINLSGNVYSDEGTTAYQCSTSGNITIKAEVDGSGSYIGTCTADTGYWSISSITATSGQTIAVYIYGMFNGKGKHGIGF